MQHLEFLYTRTAAEESVYVFKHALTQDVAYESLLTTRRQRLHTAAAQALERLYADHLPDAYDRLAYHYARTTEAEKAVTYLCLTAAKAAASYAHAEAVTTLEEALRHAERLAPESRDRQTLGLTLHLALAALASTQREPESATTHLSTAHAWFTKLQVPRWIEKTEQHAREYGVTLIEVVLEDRTEGEA